MRTRPPGSHRVFASLRLMQAASAQDAYPNRAIKLIVPFAAGGNTDVVGRLTASYMQKALNVNVVVENRAGAGGINGTDAVAKAAPDGYTLCVCGDRSDHGLAGDREAALRPAQGPRADQPDQHQSAGPRSSIRRSRPTPPPSSPRSARACPMASATARSAPAASMQFAAEIFRVKTGSKFTSVPYRGGALATGGGGHRRGPARVLQHVGCDGPARRGHGAPARHHHGQAQPAHA